jgi:glycosyltransferase involved in cell wall biosynthesis
MMKKPIKIAFDASPLLVNKTGVAFYIERLMTQLAERFPGDVELIGFYYNFLGKRSSSHFPKAKNIRYRPVRIIPSKVVYQLRRFGIEIPLELLVKEKVDFVLFGNFLGYPSIFKVPAAPVVHDLTYIDIPEYVAAKNRHDLTKFVPQQIKRSRFVVTVSEFSKKKIVEQYNVRPGDVLVTPIPPAKPQVLSEVERIAQIKDLGINKPFILFLSTIEPRKNLISLIDAYAQLSSSIRERYTLVVTGRIGWNCDAEVARLKLAVEEGLDVIHLGYVSNKAREALFQSATLYTSSSSYEGFGMPILEAMSYGRPCAVSDIAVFHEVAQESVRYFDHTSPKSIAQTLDTILSDTALQQSLSKASLQQVQRFKWADVADALYRKITENIR